MQKELGIRNKNVRKNVMLIVTENCPLRCTYCYETFKNINKRTMSFETAKQIVDFEMTVDDNYEEVVIDFFGGEPFVNFRLIEQIYDYLHSRAWPKKYICFATTNGVLVHGYIKAFLERHRKDFWCSLSIDGTPEMHNKNRSGSYNQIDVGWFSRMWPLQPVKMTISRETLPQLYDGVVYLLKKGFQISATFAQGGDFSGDETNAILEKQLERLVTFYLDNPQYPLVSLLDYEVEFLGGEKKENEKWCGCGDSMKSYDVCGNLYPCQCFTPLALEEKIGSSISRSISKIVPILLIKTVKDVSTLTYALHVMAQI